MMAYQRDRKMARFLEKLRALFNLNDPGWGRSSDSKPKADGESEPNEAPPQRPADQERSKPKLVEPQRPTPPNGGRNNNNNPPDLDELWQDLNGKIGRMFGKGGNKPSGGGNQQGGGSSGGGMRAPSIGGGLIVIALIVALLLWLASGIFIVQEGYQ